MEENKRRIPRHVDGRIKVGPMPIKSFFKFLPFLVIGLYLIFSHFTPATLFFGVVVLGLLSFLFSEFNQKETGLDIIKDIIRYAKEGDIVYERSCTQIENNKRFIWNEIEE